MKLLHVTTFRLTLLAAVLLTFWSVFFYFSIINEVNDETDDALEDYAETIIMRSLAGEEIPTVSPGSNNQYFRRRVTADYAARTPHIRYVDRDVFIKDKGETEPARVITYIYADAEGRHYELEVSTPNIDKADLQRAILWRFVMLYVTLLLGIVWVNMWGVRRSMQPLYDILHWLRRYRLGETKQPLSISTRIDEFNRLARAASDTMKRGEEIYLQQKLFVGNASHEMQTPLAVSIGRIEHLTGEGADKLSEAQLTELLKVKHTLEGLSRLNRSLLLLCRIENEAVAGGDEPDTLRLNLGAYVRNLLPDYREVYASRGISVTIDEQAPFEMQMSESLAHILVANLLKNAFVHNVAGGDISITLTERSLTIGNTSAEPVALPANRVFERFYHGRTAGSNKSSTGLGLALVRAVCRRYGMKCGYRWENARHVFEVSV